MKLSKLARNAHFIAYIFLFLAIIFEVVGTSFLKLENRALGYISMSFFIGLSYFLMGLAIRKINIGLAYAIWELLGSILVLFVCLFYFRESLNLQQICGVILALFGILLINIGSK